MSKELDKQVTEIKRLVENDKAELAIQLVLALDDPKIYEGLLEDCSIEEIENQHLKLPNWLVDYYAERDHTFFFLQLIAECPQEAKIDPSLLRENFEFLILESTGWHNGSQESPLNALPNLDLLGLGHTETSDLSPLKELTNLKSLNLDSNQITDLSPLAGLTELWELCLEANQITDLSPLAGLTNLEKLLLNYNQITDLSPLVGLTNLKDLYLYKNPIPEDQKAMLKKALPVCEIHFS